MQFVIPSSRVFLLLILFFSPVWSQWVPSNGSGASEFVASLELNEILFLGNPEGNWRSTDGGMTWTKSLLPMTSFATDSSRVYGAGYYQGLGNFIAVSTDQGLNWNTYTEGLPTPQTVLDMHVACSKGNAIVGTTAGLFVSTDQGANWVKITANLPATLSVHTLIATHDVALAATYVYGVFCSTDGGLSWRLVNLDASLRLVLTTGSVFYATKSGVEFLASTDRGTTWTVRTSSLPEANSFISVGDSIFVGGWGSSYPGVYLSTDDGVTWMPADAGLQDHRVTGLCKHKGYVFAGTRTGLFRAGVPGIRWEPLPGVHSGSAAQLTEHQGVIFLGNLDGLYRSTDEGTTWIASNEGFPATPGPPVYDLASKDSLLFAARGGSGVYRSTDGGHSWTEVNQGLNLSSGGVTCVGSFENVMFAGTNEGVFRSTNNGDTWSASSAGMRHGVVNNFSFSASYVFAATDSGVHRSSDKGMTWEPITFLSGLWSLNVQDIMVSGSDLFASTKDPNGGVYVSTNQGSTWTSSSAGLTSLNVNVLRETNSGIFACTFAGIDISRDRGASWASVSSGLPAGPMKDLLFSSIYGFAASGSVWRRPFNPRTTFRFHIPYTTHVSLKVFDLLGREVATLVNEQLPSGVYERTFRGDDLASGMYVGALKAGSFSQTRGLVLVR